MTLSELDLSPAWVRVVAFVWGTLWGSFVNVVIYRIPRGMSVVHPPSHCPSCGAPIRAWQNVPVLGWIALRGRARCCGAPLSPRYLVVEVLGGAVGVAVAELALFTSNPETSVIHVLCQSLANFGLAMALLAVAFIDAEHMIVPDPITIGGTLLALATPGLRDLSWSESFAGALVGFVGIWLPFVFAYRHLRGRPGMGLGDAKLLMLAGAWFGWRGAAFALFAGAAQATIAALAMLTMHGRIEEPEAVRADRQALEQAAAEGDAQAKELLEEDPLGSPPGEGFMAARMPFGPFLCLAMIEWMLAGEWIARRVQWLAV